MEDIHGNNLNSDFILWEKFKQGDQSALTEIYKTHYSSLYDYGFRIVKDEDFIRECIQELFLELISNIETLGVTHNVGFYLLASLRHKIFGKLRKRRYVSRTQQNLFYEFDLELSQEDFMIHKETTEKRKSELEAGINELPAREKEAVYLKFFKNMSYQEITRIMGINYDSARKLVYRAIKNLRERLHVEIND